MDFGAAFQQNHYAVLGLPASASAEDVRRAFREQARRWHPDKAGISEEAKTKYQAVSDAYDVLNDGEKRRQYDAVLQAAVASPRAASAYATRSESGTFWPPRTHTASSGPFFQAPSSPSSGSWQPEQTPRGTSTSSGSWAPDVRLTAAQLHPEGVQAPFRASVSDLKALACFEHAGKLWIPEVRDIEWARLQPDPRRMRISFAALYNATQRGARSSADLDLRRMECRDFLVAGFQAHLERVCVNFPVSTSFTLSVPDQLGLPVGDIPFKIKVTMEGETEVVLRCFQNASHKARAQKSKECPLM